MTAPRKIRLETALDQEHEREAARGKDAAGDQPILSNPVQQTGHRTFTAGFAVAESAPNADDCTILAEARFV